MDVVIRVPSSASVHVSPLKVSKEAPTEEIFSKLLLDREKGKVGYISTFFTQAGELFLLFSFSIIVSYTCCPAVG